MPNMLHGLVHIQELVVLDRSECQTAEAEVSLAFLTLFVPTRQHSPCAASSASLSCDAKPCGSLWQILAQHLIGSPSMALALRAVRLCAFWTRMSVSLVRDDSRFESMVTGSRGQSPSTSAHLSLRALRLEENASKSPSRSSSCLMLLFACLLSTRSRGVKCMTLGFVPILAGLWIPRPPRAVAVCCCVTFCYMLLSVSCCSFSDRKSLCLWSLAIKGWGFSGAFDFLPLQGRPRRCDDLTRSGKRPLQPRQCCGCTEHGQVGVAKD